MFNSQKKMPQSFHLEIKFVKSAKTDYGNKIQSANFCYNVPITQAPRTL